MDSVMDWHNTVPGFKTLKVWYTFYRASDWRPPHHHHKFSIRWCVWKVEEGFSNRVWPKTSKLVAVYSSVTFHINAQQQVGPVSILWWVGVSCPVSAAWHSCVATHWLKYHCYEQTPSWYDLRCLKAMVNPNITTNNIYNHKMLCL